MKGVGQVRHGGYEDRMVVSIDLRRLELIITWIHALSFFYGGHTQNFNDFH